MASILFSQIRLDEFEVLIENSVRKVLEENQSKFPNTTTPPERRILRSIRELADFLGCSTVTAQKLKNSGVIPYRQINRILCFDTFEVLEAMNRNKSKKR